MAEIRRPELETRRYPRIGFNLRSMGLPRTERQLVHDLADFRCIQPAVGYHRPLHFVGCHLLHGQSPLPLGYWPSLDFPGRHDFLGRLPEHL